MSSVRITLLLLLLGAASLQAQEPRWTADVTSASYVEAWDENGGREVAIGGHAGLDRAVWRGLAVRAEGVMLHVSQAGPNAWLRGATAGVRLRRRTRRLRLYLDAAVGRAQARQRVPPSGTRGNYLLIVGAGAEVSAKSVGVTFGGRWWHLSNLGSEGRRRNPDIQALGGFAGLLWRF